MKNIINFINERKSAREIALTGFVKQNEFKQHKECNFSEEEIKTLIELNPSKNIKLSKNGSLWFDYSDGQRTFLAKFIKSDKNKYVVRVSYSPDLSYPYNRNIIDERPIIYDKNSGKYWFDSFTEMVKGFIKYKKNSRILK